MNIEAMRLREQAWREFAAAALEGMLGQPDPSQFRGSDMVATACNFADRMCVEWSQSGYVRPLLRELEPD